MKVGISENFRLIEVFDGIHYACLESPNRLSVFFEKNKGSGAPLLTAQYPDHDRAAEALEKLMKKDYLTIPKDFIEKK